MTGRVLKSKMRLHTAMLSGNVVTLCPADRHIQFHDSGQHMAGHTLLHLGTGNRPGIVDLGNRALDTVQFGAVGGQVLAV